MENESFFNLKSLINTRKEELKNSRAKNIVYLDNLEDALYAEADDNTDVVFIEKQSTHYRLMGEIEIIPVLNLLFNPFLLNHNIIYEVVDKESIKKFEGKKLPVLSYSDPVRIWKGWLPYTVIKIIRSNGKIYYREVENKPF